MTVCIGGDWGRLSVCITNLSASLTAFTKQPRQKPPQNWDALLDFSFFSRFSSFNDGSSPLYQLPDGFSAETASKGSVTILPGCINV